MTREPSPRILAICNHVAFIPGPDDVAAGIVALAALAAVATGLAYLRLAPTGLSPSRDAVSQYGITDPARVIDHA